MNRTNVSTMAATRTRRWRMRWWYWPVLAILLPPLALGGFIAFQLNRHYFPRFDLPAFDTAKAAQLTPEKRASYEQELFSELSQWNVGSRRYPDRGDFIRRERRWQELADDGLELAHITLSVLRPSILQIYALWGPMRRLEKLAEQGDAGAMCLMTMLVSRAALKLNTDRYDVISKRWLERGTELGHPECLMRLGGRLLLGVGGKSQDIHRGLGLDFAARRAGYPHDVGALIHYYAEKERDEAPPTNVRRFYGFGSGGRDRLSYRDLENVRRLHCWLQIEAQTRNWNMSQELLEDLEHEAQRTHRPELTALHHELEGRQYKLQDCVRLGTGE